MKSGFNITCGTLLLLLLLATGTPRQLRGQSLSYLALGDSYTIGESVSPQERWPALLADALRKNGHPVAEPEIVAVTGWTTGDLIKAIDNKHRDADYDLVTLLIGVNNQYRGYDIQRYRDEFALLLETSIKLAGGRPGHVLVLSIPDYGVTPFARTMNPQRISSEIAAYNKINHSISRRTGVLYLNITPITRMAEADPSLLAADGLHPSGKMYRQWVEQLMPVLMPVLRTWNPK